jgi:hypothetical protein
MSAHFHSRLPALLFAVVAPLIGAPHVTVRFVDQLPESHFPVPLTAKLDLIRQASLNQPEDEHTYGVIGSARAAYREYFRPERAELAGAATLTHHNQDVLLARWKTDYPDHGLSEILLWDEPGFTSYLFRVDPKTLRDGAGLQRLLDDLLDWSKVDRHRRLLQSPSLQLPPIEVGLVWNPKTGDIDGATKPWLLQYLYQFAGGMLDIFSMEAYGTTEYAYIDFTLGKRPISSHYREGMVWIAERFPPLRERVKDWSKDRVLWELGKGRTFAPIFGSRDRDVVLLKELFCRDVAPREFAALLGRSDLPSETTQFTILRLAIEAHRGKQFESVIREFLDRVDNTPGQHWIEATYSTKSAVILNYMRPIKDVDLTNTAWRRLSSIQAGGEAELSYLRERIQGWEDYRSLRELSLPERLESARRDALREIRMRLGFAVFE